MNDSEVEGVWTPNECAIKVSEHKCHTLICFTCLCACSHPHPGVAHLPHYPQCIYTCVLWLSVASSFCLSSLPAVFHLLVSVSSSCFLVLTILPWPWACLPFRTLSHNTGLLTSACPDPETAYRCHVLTLVPLLCLYFSLVREWVGVGILCFCSMFCISGFGLVWFPIRGSCQSLSLIENHT
jgi:hypothetical protein